jgi:hypothetical protein
MEGGPESLRFIHRGRQHLCVSRSFARLSVRLRVSVRVRMESRDWYGVRLIFYEADWR